MQAVTLKEAKRNLSNLVEQVLADAEPRIVVTDKGGQVVLMPLDEFNSWKETLYLLATLPTPRICAAPLQKRNPGTLRRGIWSKNESELHTVGLGRLPMVSAA